MEKKDLGYKLKDVSKYCFTGFLISLAIHFAFSLNLIWPQDIPGLVILFFIAGMVSLTLSMILK